MLRAIKEFDGYPRLRELGGMVPSLSALQVKVIVHYLERNGAIMIDGGGHIVWTRTERQNLTLGEVAEFGRDVKEYLDRQGNSSELD